MQKRILLIRNAQGYDFGGGERFPVFVARIIQQGYGVPIIISSSHSLLKFAASENIKTVHGLWWSNQNWSGARVLLFPIYLVWQIILFFWYLALFIRLKPHVVHIQSKDDFIAATFAGKLVAARVIWTDHADLKHIWLNLGVWYKNPIGKLVYLAGHFANTITVISMSEYREVTKHLSAKSSLRNKLKIINNGSPDIKDQYPATKSGIFTFCSTNRLVTDKGISEMISAFKQFHKKHPDSKLTLVGNGPEEERFKALAKNEPSIVFEGYQSNPLAFVAASDVLLQPTYHEGFSISILESFMMEKPVIATAVGGNVEMIKDTETGLLVPAKNSDSLYKAMEKIYKDQKLRKRLAKNARAEYEKKYVFDVIVNNEFIPLYEGKTI